MSRYSRSEEHQEFVARMDRARSEGERKKNLFAISYILFWVSGAILYFFVWSGNIPWLAIFLILANAVIVFVAVQAIIVVYRSTRPKLEGNNGKTDP